MEDEKVLPAGKKRRILAIFRLHTIKKGTLSEPTTFLRQRKREFLRSKGSRREFAPMPINKISASMTKKAPFPTKQPVAEPGDAARIADSENQGFFLRGPGWKGATMEKWLCIGSIGVAALMFLLFLLDLIVGFPFSSGTPPKDSSPFSMIDVFGMLGAGIVGYLGWNAFRDVK
jgi:hypothetical protein